MFEKTNPTKTSWARRALVATTGLAALAISAGSALAGPTLTINGVTFPVGIVPGGNQIDSSVLAESVITQAGQQDIGVGLVNSIGPTATTTTWSNGQNGVELAFTFTYNATHVTAPTNTINGQILFNGGTISFYTLAAGTAINGLGSMSQDVAAVESGTLWLSAVGAVEDSNGDTLISTIPAGTTLTSFGGGQGEGFLDVTGGPAGGSFHTGTFANAFDTTNAGFPGYSDASFTSDFSVGAGGDFPISGSDTVKANAVPEPGSLALLGVGLFGTGFIVRRRRRR